MVIVVVTLLSLPLSPHGHHVVPVIIFTTIAVTVIVVVVVITTIIFTGVVVGIVFAIVLAGVQVVIITCYVTVGTIARLEQRSLVRLTKQNKRSHVWFLSDKSNGDLYSY